MTLITQYLLYGLVSGGLYALIACGLVVAYRASGFLNFAHPYVGMVATLAFVLTAPTVGVVPALLLGLLVGTALAAGTYVAVFARLSQGPLGPKVIVALAVGICLQVVGGILFIRYQDDLLGGGRRSLLPQSLVGFLPGDLVLTWQQLAVPLLAAVVLVGLLWLFQRTDFGLALRACAQNPLSAGLAGLPRRAVETGAWALTGALAALAGIAWLSSQAFLVPTYLFEESIRGFVAALAGGFVDLRRAVIAAMAIGVLEQQLVGAPAPLDQMQGAVSFALITLIAILGVAGRQSARMERAE
jgi:branched-chain amino acid transport system permease protein